VFVAERQLSVHYVPDWLLSSILLAKNWSQRQKHCILVTIFITVCISKQHDKYSWLRLEFYGVWLALFAGPDLCCCYLATKAGGSA